MNTSQLLHRFNVPIWTILCSTGLVLLAAFPALGEQKHWQNNTSRAYALTIPGGEFMTAAAGKVEAWASAQCGCGTDAPPTSSDSGYYITITRNPPDPPSAVTQDLVAFAEAHVAHADAEARQSITPWVTIDGNTANIEVFVHSYTNKKREDCGDGPSKADAGVKAVVDPIVIGSNGYTSYTGQQLDPFLPDFDGVYRYVDEVVSLLEGTGMPGALSGPSPDTAPDGLRKVNGFRVSQNVRSGSDDDPDNTSGTLVYDLSVTAGPDGNPVVTCTLGTDTAEFGFSFDRTAAQIEQDVDDYLTGTGEGDLPVLTVRVRMLQAEGTMPNMTLVAVDELESWLWGSGNPDAIDWPIKWWQGPDVLGSTRPSSLLLPSPVRADDFECTSTGTIDAVRWWGTYAGELWWHRVNTGFTLPFVIYFYNSDGTPHPNSLPVTGEPLSTHNVMANRFFVNWLPTGDALYEFHARLCVPFQQQAGLEYFMSIADPYPGWEWLEATCSLLDQPAWGVSPGGPWQHDGFPDLAFALLAPTAVPDFDCDGDVDLDDYVVFVDCLAGPGVPPTPTQPGVTEQNCLHAFDFEDDGDVDLEDFGGFQEAFGN